VADLTQIIACEGTAQASATTVCNLIKRAQKGSGRLSMQINGDSFMAAAGLEAKERYVSRRCHPLPLELSMFDEFSNMSKQEINELAVILAHTLLQLYDNLEGPLCWMSPDWIYRNNHWKTPQWTKLVRFFKHGKLRPQLDIQQPYLLTQINGPSSTEELPFDNLDSAIHQAPSILALGIALLELQIRHLRLPVQSYPLSEDQDDDDKSNVNTDFIIADQLLEQCKDKLDPFFSQAVNACLTIRPKGCVKDFIYKEIVKPLEWNAWVNPRPKQIERTVSPTYSTADRPTSTEADFCLYGDKEEQIDPERYVN
jgi:hypothetical protein